MRSLNSGLLATFAAAMHGGCITSSQLQSEPQDWAAPAHPAAVGDCPVIAGLYGNSAAEGSAPGERSRYRWKNSWDGDTHLISNIFHSARDMPFLDAYRNVEIEQPDANTVRVRVPAGSSVPMTLKRGDGDFGCKGDRLTITSTGSVISAANRPTTLNTLSTSLGALVLEGGVGSISRSFYRLSDGSLAMEAEDRGAAWFLIIGAHEHRRLYVRWRAAKPAPE
jgi:hypothetical protein